MIFLLPFLVSTAMASYSPAANIFDENGVAFSTANPLQTETIVSGSSIDPRQIRALSSGTDSCTVTGTVTSNIGTIGAISTEATLSTVSTRIGDVTEAAPVSDTASSGLNGRLQRIAQRLTSLIAVFNPLTSIPNQSSSGLATRPIPYHPATFIARSEATALASGKSMISLENAAGSAVVVRVMAVNLMNVQTTGVTGVMAEFGARRFTSHSAGTSITIDGRDSSDAINGSVTARTGATITGDSGVNNFGRRIWSADEHGVGGLDVQSNDAATQNTAPSFNFSHGEPVILRAGEGLHIRMNTATAVGSYDLEIIFTQESA